MSEVLREYQAVVVCAGACSNGVTRASAGDHSSSAEHTEHLEVSFWSRLLNATTTEALPNLGPVAIRLCFEQERQRTNSPSNVLSVTLCMEVL